MECSHVVSKWQSDTYCCGHTLDIGVGVEYFSQEKIQGWVIMKVLFRAEWGRQQERDLRGSMQQELSW